MATSGQFNKGCKTLLFLKRSWWDLKLRGERVKTMLWLWLTCHCNPKRDKNFRTTTTKLLIWMMAVNHLFFLTVHKIWNQIFNLQPEIYNHAANNIVMSVVWVTQCHDAHLEPKSHQSTASFASANWHTNIYTCTQNILFCCFCCGTPLSMMNDPWSPVEMTRMNSCII